VSGVVSGRGLVSVSPAAPRPAPALDTTSSLGPDETASPVSVAASLASPLASKSE
jgi:hypothetical protein